MSTIELSAYCAPSSRRNALARGLHAFRAWLRQRHDERNALRALARLEPRLLADIGFEPRQVYAAADGDTAPRLPDRAPGWDTRSKSARPRAA